MMQADEITRIEAKLSTARAKLLATVDGLDDAAWEWRPEDGRWSIRLTLAHVGAAQWGHLDFVRRLVKGEPTDLPDFDLDTWNKARVAERTDWSKSQILADMEAAQQETLVLLRGLDPSQLSIAGTHPALGDITIGQVVRVIALHDGLHRRDVLQLLREMDKVSLG